MRAGPKGRWDLAGGAARRASPRMDASPPLEPQRGEGIAFRADPPVAPPGLPCGRAPFRGLASLAPGKIPAALRALCDAHEAGDQG